MTYYNLSSFDNSTNLLHIAQTVNTASGNWLFGLLLISLWILLIMVFIDNNFVDLMLGSSFLMCVISGLLFGIGLINGWVLTIPLITLALSLVSKLWVE